MQCIASEGFSRVAPCSQRVPCLKSRICGHQRDLRETKSVMRLRVFESKCLKINPTPLENPHHRTKDLLTPRRKV